MLTRIEKLKQNCNAQWDAHWKCLDKNNQMFEKCRSEEMPFNECIFNKLVSCFNKGHTKVIPDTPEDQIPIHLKPSPAFQ